MINTRIFEILLREVVASFVQFSYPALSFFANVLGGVLAIVVSLFVLLVGIFFVACFATLLLTALQLTIRFVNNKIREQKERE